MLTKLRTCLQCLTTSVLLAALAVTAAQAQLNYPLHDNFDHRVTFGSPEGFWSFNDPNGSMEASSGDLKITSTNTFVDAHLVAFNGVNLEQRTEWSFKARMTVHEGLFAAVGTTVFNHAGLIPGASDSDSDQLRVGTSGTNERIDLPLDDYFNKEIVLQLDAFGGQLTGHIWMPDVAGSYATLTTPYSPRRSLPNFGVGSNRVGDNSVTIHEAWVHTEPIPLPASIPEPAAGSLLLLGLAALAQIRRRTR